MQYMSHHSYYFFIHKMSCNNENISFYNQNGSVKSISAIIIVRNKSVVTLQLQMKTYVEYIIE